MERKKSQLFFNFPLSVDMGKYMEPNSGNVWYDLKASCRCLGCPASSAHTNPIFTPIYVYTGRSHARGTICLPRTFSYTSFRREVIPAPPASRCADGDGSSAHFSHPFGSTDKWFLFDDEDVQALDTFGVTQSKDAERNGATLSEQGVLPDEGKEQSSDKEK